MSKVKCPSFIPTEIFEELKDASLELRVQAIHNLHQYILSLEKVIVKQPSDLDFIIPYFSSTSVKVAISSFLILRDILGKLENSNIDDEIRDVIIPVLIEKWNDGKLVIRHATSSVMAKIASRILGGNELIRILIDYLPEASLNVKEEMINFIIFCLLKHSHSAYDYGEIINCLIGSVKDPKLRIKFVSVEALAVIHSNIGNRILPYLEQFKQNDSKTFKLLQERFKQPTLPMLSKTTKGVVEHKLLLRLHRQSPQAKGRRVQSASVSKVGEIDSSFNSTDLNSSDLNNSNQTQVRYPTRIGKSKPEVIKNDEDESSRSKYRAHSAPRRLQSDDEYVTFDPNSNDMLDNDKEDSFIIPKNNTNAESQKSFSINDDDVISDDEGFVPLRKSITTNQNVHHGYRYRNSIVDTEEDQAIPASLNSTIDRDTTKNIIRKSSSQEDDSKINLWLSQKREEPNILEDNSRKVLRSTKKVEESTESIRRRDIGRATPRSKRLLAINIDEEEEKEESIFPKVNDTIESHSSKKSFNPDQDLEYPSSTQLRSKRTLDFNITDDSKEDANSEQPALSNHVRQSRKRPRPIRVINPISVQSSDSKESPVSVNSVPFTSPNKNSDCLERHELLPCSNAQLVLHKALENLSNSDWEIRFNAVTDVRRICVHHSEVIISQGVHDIVSLISKYIMDLRSLLAKNAIICVQDLYEFLGKHLDNDLSKVVPLLLKKTGESNRFICTQADLALKTIVKYGNTEKCLVIILPFGEHKNSVIRTSSAQIILEAIQELGTRIFRFKDMNKLLTSVVALIEDSSASVRSLGRFIAFTIAQHFNTVKKMGGFERYISKYLTTMQIGTFLEAVEKTESNASTPVSIPSTPTSTSASTSTTNKHATRRFQTRNRPPESPNNFDLNTSSNDTSDVLLTPISTKSTTSHTTQRDTFHSEEKQEKTKKLRTLRIKKPAIAKRLIDDRTNESLKTICNQLNGNAWKEKFDALGDLKNLVENNPTMFGEYETVQLMDVLILRLSDANVKVCARSFKTLSAIIPIIYAHLSQFLYRIIHQTGLGLGANHITVQEEAAKAFRVLAQHTDSVSMISHIPQLMNSNNSKVKGLLLDQFVPLITNAYSLKPEAVIRYVVPATYKLVQDTKNLSRNSTISLMKVLYECLGDELYAYGYDLPIEDLERLKDQINS